jgi:hypothetical protein
MMWNDVRTRIPMTEFSARTRIVVAQARPLIFFGAVSSLAILLSGCAAQRIPAIPWTTAVLVRPVALKSSSLTTDLEDPVPDLRMEIPPPPPPLAARTAPPRPRGSVPLQNQNSVSVKPEAPQVVPDLTTQESASLQQETNESLNAAARNLKAASGKSLNATQSDLASKVRSFISDARAAAHSGDWARARDLAKKAQVLSEQLAESL